MVDRSETDDFLRAKRMLVDGLELDSYMEDKVTVYLRDSVPGLMRKQAAQDILAATREKRSPVGWLRTVLENGTLDSALRAHEGLQARRERQIDRPGASGRREMRRRLLELYRAVSGSDVRSESLDDDGGLPWREFSHRAPRLAQGIKVRLDKKVQGGGWTESQNGESYAMVQPPSWDQWLEVIDEFILADGARQEAGVSVTTL